jgi:tape measure domain-containing protein
MAGKSSSIDLIIRAVDRATAVIKNINSQIDRLVEPVRRVNNAVAALTSESGFGRLTKQIGNVGSSLSRVSTEAQRSATKMAVGFGVAGYAFNRFLIDPAANFEKQQAMMLSASRGSAELAAKNMEWVRRFAMDTPLTMNETIDSFIRLKNWGIDPANGSLRAMVEQMSSMGGNKDMLDGIILAFGQSYTAGKLQGQDIGQLTTRGVPVWDLLSQSMGKPIAQLRKLSEAGKIGRKEIDALVMAMGARSAGAMERLMKTWNGIISRLQDFVDIFAIMVMDAGVFDFLKGKLEGLLTTLQAMQKDGSLAKLARDIGQGLTQAFEAVWKAAPQIWGAMKGLYGIFMSFSDAVGGVQNALIILGGAYVFGPLILAVAGATTAVAALGVALSGPLLIGVTLAIKGIAAMSAALVALPGGWVIASIIAIGAVAHVIYDNWEPIKAWWTGFWTDFVARVKGAWNDITSFIGGLGTTIGNALYGALTYAFSIAKAAVPQWFLDLTGGVFSFGSDLGNRIGRELDGIFGPAAPAAAARPQQSRARIDVNFANAPRGMRPKVTGSGFTDLNMNTGYAMGDAR